MHTHRAKPGYITRAGIHRILAWTFLFKNFSVRDFAEFLEIYGLPLRLGKYQRDATKKEQSTLLKAVLGIGHSAGGIIPQGMEIEFQEAAKGGSDPFIAMIQWAEKSQSKAILGQTLSADVGNSGSFAAAKVHEGVRHDILAADARQVSSTLTRDLVYPIGALNGWITDNRRGPRFVFETDLPEDKALFADAIPKLVAVGLQIPSSYVHEKLMIPTAKDGEPVLRLESPAPAPAPTALSSVAKLTESPPSPNEYKDQAVLDQSLDGLTAEMLNAQMVGILKPIREQAEKNPNDLLAQLAQVYPDMDDAALIKQMTQLIFVADTWGRLNG